MKSVSKKEQAEIAASRGFQAALKKHRDGKAKYIPLAAAEKIWSRQAASIATIRVERRLKKLCLWCGGPSPGKLVCAGCRPGKGGHGGNRKGADRPQIPAD